MEKLSSYKAFWPYYVSLHHNRVNRNLHFLGTALVFLCVVLGVTSSVWFFALIPFVGYGFAFLGHYVFEKNRPATFQYPLWSLVADFHMFAFMAMGRMDREVKRMDVLSEK